MTNSSSAGAGWLWIKQGFALFRKQPMEMSRLFFGYMLLMLLLSMIPILGGVLRVILMPVFSMVFMQACADIEREKQVATTLLLNVFRSPALPRLLGLGVAYVVAILGSLTASSLIDGGALWQLITSEGPIDKEVLNNPDLTSAMLFAGLLYIPAAMAFWYAAPLVAWHDMGIGKALFYSFFAVWRAIKAFAVYSLGWLLIGVLVVGFANMLLLVTGSRGLAIMALVPLWLVAMVGLHCSFYPTYTQIFGKRQTTDLSQHS